jgi:UDP-glucose 4-epimerase
MLQAYAKAYDMGCVSLRYFNVAGADPAGGVGEDHRPETHLIPLTLQVAAGRRKNIQIFGDDYDTPDGTCIRDYVHVCDLAEAHILALGAIECGAVKVYNLGNGDGFSVKQVVDVCRNVTGHPIPSEVQGRRAGDPARLVASAEKAFKELGWHPRYPGLEQMVVDAWAWHRSHPSGYR